MENTENLLPEYSAKPKFKQTPATEREWLEIGRWARFFAIYGFVYVGLNIVGILYILIILIPLISNPAFMLPPSMLLAAGILLFLVLGGLLSMFLGSRHHYRYAQDIKRAISLGDQTLLTSAWRNMKGAWKVYGIFTIIMVGFYFLLLTAMGYVMQQNPYFSNF